MSIRIEGEVLSWEQPIEEKSSSSEQATQTFSKDITTILAPIFQWLKPADQSHLARTSKTFYYVFYRDVAMPLAHSLQIGFKNPSPYLSLLGIEYKIQEQEVSTHDETSRLLCLVRKILDTRNEVLPKDLQYPSNELIRHVSEMEKFGSLVHQYTLHTCFQANGSRGFPQPLPIYRPSPTQSSSEAIPEKQGK